MAIPPGWSVGGAAFEDVFDLCVTDFWEPVYCRAWKLRNGRGSCGHNLPGHTHSLTKGRAFPKLPNDDISACL